MCAFHGQMGMFVRAMSYMLAHGADGMRQASEDAVLNANYVKAGLKDLMSLPFGDRPACTRCCSTTRGSTAPASPRSISPRR
jgi:glycine dehydrogenase subunit 2